MGKEIKRMIKFGSIHQLRNIVKVMNYHIQERNHSGKVTALATEKIHGMNAGVCYTEAGTEPEFWVQSRNHVIAPGGQNAGCAQAALDNKNAWMEIIGKLTEKHSINLKENIITVYYEWAGGNIQSNSAFTGLDKKAVIFAHYKVTPAVETLDDEGLVINESSWHSTEGIQNDQAGIYNITNLHAVQVSLDFNIPALEQQKLLDMVHGIESKSPTGAKFGKDNIGEGVVVTFFVGSKLIRFKVKGEKHSKTKVKTLKPVDENKEKAKIEFANYACTASRLEQQWQEVFGVNNEKEEPSIQRLGVFLGNVNRDIIKEESDVLREKGLTNKEVCPVINRISRQWFKDQLDTLMFQGSR